MLSSDEFRVPVHLLSYVSLSLSHVALAFSFMFAHSHCSVLVSNINLPSQLQLTHVSLLVAVYSSRSSTLPPFWTGYKCKLVSSSFPLPCSVFSEYSSPSVSLSLAASVSPFGFSRFLFSIFFFLVAVPLLSWLPSVLSSSSLTPIAHSISCSLSVFIFTHPAPTFNFSLSVSAPSLPTSLSVSSLFLVHALFSLSRIPLFFSSFLPPSHSAFIPSLLYCSFTAQFRVHSSSLGIEATGRVWSGSLGQGMGPAS